MGVPNGVSAETPTTGAVGAIPYFKGPRVLEENPDFKFDGLNLFVPGTIQQGDLAPATKKAIYTGTLPAAQGGQTIFSLDAEILTANIVSVSLIVDWSGTGAWMACNFTPYSGYEANVYFNNGSPVSAFVSLATANSSFIVNNPFKLIVEYSI